MTSRGGHCTKGAAALKYRSDVTGGPTSVRERKEQGNRRDRTRLERELFLGNQTTPGARKCMAGAIGFGFRLEDDFPSTLGLSLANLRTKYDHRLIQMTWTTLLLAAFRVEMGKWR